MEGKIILKKIGVKNISPRGLSQYAIPSIQPVPVYEAARLKKGGPIEDGWDIPEGYGIEKIPGEFTGLSDPELLRIL